MMRCKSRRLCRGVMEMVASVRTKGKALNVLPWILGAKVSEVVVLRKTALLQIYCGFVDVLSW